MPRKSTALRVSALRRKSAPKNTSARRRDDSKSCPKHRTPGTLSSNTESAIDHQDTQTSLPETCNRVNLKRTSSFEEHTAIKRTRRSSHTSQVQSTIPQDESLALSAPDPDSIEMSHEKSSLLGQNIDFQYELQGIAIHHGDLEAHPDSSTQASFASIDDLYTSNQSSGSVTPASYIDGKECTYPNLEHPRPLPFLQSPLTFDGFFQFDGVLCNSASDFAFWGATPELDTGSVASRASERSFWENFGGVSFEQKASEPFVDIYFPDFVDLDLDAALPSFTLNELDTIRSLDVIQDLNQPWSVV